MEIDQVSSVRLKQEQREDTNQGQADLSDELDMDVKIEPSERNETCAICSSAVPELDFWEHVKGRHGLVEVEYQSVARTLQSPR